MHPIIWSHFRSIQRAWVLRTPYGNRKRISRGQYNTAQGWIYAQGNLCQRLGPGVRLCIHRFQCIFGKWIVFFFPRTVHHTMYAHSLFLVVCFWVCVTLILPICIRANIPLAHCQWHYPEEYGWNNYVKIIPANCRSRSVTVCFTCALNMMTSLNGNIFRVTGYLCGEFTGPRWIPRTKASDAELWCFLWSAPE